MAMMVPVIGSTTTVERYLNSKGLPSLSEPFQWHRLGFVLDAGAGIAQVTCKIAEESGQFGPIAGRATWHSCSGSRST